MEVEEGEGKQEGDLHQNEGLFKMRTAAAAAVRRNTSDSADQRHHHIEGTQQRMEATRCSAAKFLTCCWSDAMDVHRAAGVGAAQAM